MSKFDQAARLVDYSKSQLHEIEKLYEESLHAKAVSDALLIAIKNLMENLRSALDYTAHGLFSKLGSATKRNPKIYFPYAVSGQTEADYRSRVANCIPGLPRARPDIVDKLCSFQQFADAGNAWLLTFMNLNNSNKHQNLTPQIRRETKELRLISGGAAINVRGGASITLTGGAQIRVGNMLIPGGQRIDSRHTPLTIGDGKKERITWVSFLFADTGDPVLPFLRNAVEKTSAIVGELSAM